MCIDQFFCVELDEDKLDPEKHLSEPEYQGHKNVSTLVSSKQYLYCNVKCIMGSQIFSLA